jgi:hypothetical protein
MAYNDEQIQEAKDLIIEEMVKGNSLVSIVENNPQIPRIRTIFNWLNSGNNSFDSEFLRNYARAQEIRAEREFEEIKTIADDQVNDVYYDKDGNECINHNVINRSRLMVDARKWRISKMQPKKYGDKLDITSGEKPINNKPSFVFVDKLKK